jgi:hypothetical protein
MRPFQQQHGGALYGCKALKLIFVSAVNLTAILTLFLKPAHFRQASVHQGMEPGSSEPKGGPFRLSCHLW